jgi:hypothetical protein
MAKARCSNCGGSGWFDQQHGKKCGHCYGTGQVHVPDKPVGGVNRPACFVGSTVILTPSGVKPIADLIAGDQVISYDQNTGDTMARRIKKQLSHSRALIWEVYVSENPEPIGTTKVHSFLTTQGWKQTSQLEPGNILVTIDGQAMVSSVVRTDRTEPVYNLITEGENTVVARGCVVHNFTYFRRLRVWWHRCAPVLDLSYQTNSAPVEQQLACIAGRAD